MLVRSLAKSVVSDISCPSPPFPLPLSLVNGNGVIGTVSNGMQPAQELMSRNAVR